MAQCLTGNNDQHCAWIKRIHSYILSISVDLSYKSYAQLLHLEKYEYDYLLKFNFRINFEKRDQVTLSLYI